MKKSIVLIALILSVVIGLAGCGSEKEKLSNTVSVERSGTVYLVDKSAGTVYDGRYTYTFGGAGSATVINYPDGSTYTWRETGGIATGSSSGNPYAAGYADPLTLRAVMQEASSMRTEQEKSRHTGIGILLLIIGITNAIWPQVGWYLSGGWRNKDAEPSDAAIFLYRGGGIAAAVIGFFLLFV